MAARNGRRATTSNKQGRQKRWQHETFDDWLFRSMIGPAQPTNAVQCCDQQAREQWKRDLENRKRYTCEQRGEEAPGARQLAGSGPGL